MKAQWISLVLLALTFSSSCTCTCFSIYVHARNYSFALIKKQWPFYCARIQLKLEAAASSGIYPLRWPKRAQRYKKWDCISAAMVAAVTSCLSRRDAFWGNLVREAVRVCEQGMVPRRSLLPGLGTYGHTQKKRPHHRRAFFSTISDRTTNVCSPAKRQKTKKQKYRTYLAKVVNGTGAEQAQVRSANLICIHMNARHASAMHGGRGARGGSEKQKNDTCTSASHN